VQRFYSLELPHGDAFCRGSRRFFLVSGKGAKLENAHKLQVWMNCNRENVRWSPFRISIFVPILAKLELDTVGDIQNHFRMKNQFYFMDSLSIYGKPNFLESRSDALYDKRYINIKTIQDLGLPHQIIRGIMPPILLF